MSEEWLGFVSTGYTVIILCTYTLLGCVLAQEKMCFWLLQSKQDVVFKK